MRLTAWKGEAVHKADVTVAKNYLDQDEARRCSMRGPLRRAVFGIAGTGPFDGSKVLVGERYAEIHPPYAITIPGDEAMTLPGL